MIIFDRRTTGKNTHLKLFCLVGWEGGYLRRYLNSVYDLGVAMKCDKGTG